MIQLYNSEILEEIHLTRDEIEAMKRGQVTGTFPLRKGEIPRVFSLQEFDDSRVKLGSIEAFPYVDGIEPRPEPSSYFFFLKPETIHRLSEGKRVKIQIPGKGYISLREEKDRR